MKRGMKHGQPKSTEKNYSFKQLSSESIFQEKNYTSSSDDKTFYPSPKLFSSDTELSCLSSSTDLCFSKKFKKRKAKPVKSLTSNKTFDPSLELFPSNTISSSDLCHSSSRRKNKFKLVKFSVTNRYHSTNKKFKAEHRLKRKSLIADNALGKSIADPECNFSFTGKKLKDFKVFKSYRKRVVKKFFYSFSIPIQSSCLSFCQTSTPIKKSVVKKEIGKPADKKKERKFYDSNSFNKGTNFSFSSKGDSFWDGIQPRWSSIYEHSLVYEKIMKGKLKPIFYEHIANKNQSIREQANNESSIVNDKCSLLPGSNSRLSNKDRESYDHDQTLVIKKSDEKNTAYVVFKQDEKENQTSNRQINLVNSDSCNNTCKISKTNEFVCKDTDTIYLENNSSKIELKKFEDNIASEMVDDTFNLKDNVTKSINVEDEFKNIKDSQVSSKDASDSKKFVSVNLTEGKLFYNEKNIYENTSIQFDSGEIKLVGSEVCKKLKSSDAEIISNDKKRNLINIFSSSNVSCANLETNSKEIVENTSSKENIEGIVFKAEKKFLLRDENNEDRNLKHFGESFQWYAPSETSKGNEVFYSSPAISNFSEEKIPATAEAFNSTMQKTSFLASTPKNLFQVNEPSVQLWNASKIYSSVKPCTSLQELDSYISNRSPIFFLSTGDLFVSTRKNQTHSSLIQNIVNKDCAYHQKSNSWSFSKTEFSILEKNHCCARSFNSLEITSYSSLTNSISKCDLESTLFNKLLEICDQTTAIPFKEIYDWRRMTVRKIGEGSFAEVFTLVQKRLSSVLKIIPFSETNETHNMQSIENVLSEVKILHVHVVKGCYPDQMLFAWDKFDAIKTSCNIRPDIFNEQQLFAVIEMEYGGKDLTHFVLRNAVEAESILKQIAISLAIAEEAYFFEHRDLHLGNILVKRNRSKTISYVLRGQAFSIPSNGLIITIIDYTLSRLLDNGCIFYNNLADNESLFSQTGDYQFEVYKALKLHLNNEWHNCLLYSNVLWLTFLCVKLLELEYSRPSSKKHQVSLKNLEILQHNLKLSKSAVECLTDCNIITFILEESQNSKSKMCAKVKVIVQKSSKFT
ncbi:hypothetical protein CDAR_530991 [Caerostris darwini]|uniref:non-specific serine/threonine protein kinase n=1 Tax=Caerostris darwini TaxID=1538125 RepID=A0AAV4VV17_9ARAC|nr:hypothetical protein CDAR_530991 [Caerostris darwini]